MADIRMMSAFGTVPGDAQEGILRVLRHALETVAQEDNSFTRAKAVFTESDERCGLTAELDGNRPALDGDRVVQPVFLENAFSQLIVVRRSPGALDNHAQDDVIGV